MSVIAHRVDPRPVAISRIGLGLAALINTLELFVVLSGVASGKLSMPLVDWVPSMTPMAAHVLMAIGITAAVMIIVGIGTATGCVIYTVTTMAALLWDQQTYSSHQIVVVLLIAYLAFAESDKAFSLVSRTGARPDVPWWPQLLMMTQLSALYLFAGLSKINSEFLSGDPLSGWVRLPLPEWIFPPMAVATVVTESLVLSVGLWLSRLRVVAVVAGVCLHLSILTMLTDNLLVVLQLTAFALACVLLYPLFLTRPSLRHGGQEAASPVMKQAPRPTMSWSRGSPSRLLRRTSGHRL